METKEIRLCRRFCLSGMIGAVFYLLHDVVGAGSYPGYNWMSQAVSDLTATDARPLPLQADCLPSMGS